MKRRVYTIADEEFATFLDRVANCFKAAEVDYMLVGGMATQAHVARYLCLKNDSNLTNLSTQAGLRLQDYLRATDDIDLTVRVDYGHPAFGKDPNSRSVILAKSVGKVLRDIASEDVLMSLTGNHLIGVQMTRSGHVRPKFQLSLDGVIDPEKELSFNIYDLHHPSRDQLMAEFETEKFDYFQNRAVSINVPYCDGKDLHLRVKHPADVLATKIARGREKDITDALSLLRNSKLAGEPIDTNYVHEVICDRDGKVDCADLRLCDRWRAFESLAKTLENQ